MLLLPQKCFLPTGVSIKHFDNHDADGGASADSQLLTTYHQCEWGCFCGLSNVRTSMQMGVLLRALKIDNVDADADASEDSEL